MHIRPAAISDLATIRAIYEDAILNTTAVYEDEPFTEEYISKWFAEKQANNFPVLVCESDGEITGFCTYGHFRLRTLYHPSKEHSVYVHPTWRGQGHGKLLLQAIIDEARKNKVHTLIGGIDAENEMSIALHAAYHFKEVARISEVAFKFGRYLDLVLMQKIL
ncbi:MAG: N-acetyltransferase family protein [Flavobacteriales bacterium]